MCTLILQIQNMQQRPVGTDGLVSMWESEVGGCIMAYSVLVNQQASN